MSSQSEQRPGLNSWLEDELYQEYVHDRGTVDESWREVFDSAPHQPNGQPALETAVAVRPPAVVPSSTPAAAPPAPALALSPSDQLVPLKGAPLRVAENMILSLAVPTATSQRTIAVKVIDENRRLLNQMRELHGKSKVSYTHLTAWAIVRALKALPGINDAYAELGGAPHRVVRREINLGIAVDVAGKDGHRGLMVPNIKNAGALSFLEYLAAFDDLVARARTERGFSETLAHDYFTRYIVYELGSRHLEGLERFRQLVRQLDRVAAPATSTV